MIHFNLWPYYTHSTLGTYQADVPVGLANVRLVGSDSQEACKLPLSTTKMGLVIRSYELGYCIINLQ